MPRGGKRIGAGRPSSSLAQRSQKIAKDALESGEISPLEVLLEAMRKTYKEEGAAAAVPFARDAAPYMHPKIAPTEQKIEVNLGGMKTIEELDAMYEEAVQKTRKQKEELLARRAHMFASDSPKADRQT